ncbi:MAG: hypothetical protein M3R50_04010 [Bacteroidota bacterium]|nr:hypothetical protein [Bacteroidota bacterium]
MKHYKLIGGITCILLFACCFMPWTYYADLNKNFTGFFSEKNIYGKPGIFFSFIAIVSAILISLDKMWAKRTHIFFSAINIGYLIKTYIVYTSCYNTYCPETKYGFYILVGSCLLLLVVSLFPNVKLMPEEETDNKP